MKTIIWVTGSRSYLDEKKVELALAEYEPGSAVVTGQADGADTIADAAARRRGMFVVRVPYASHLGRAGGPARNDFIARLVAAFAGTFGWPKVCLAFGTDRGTDGSVALARKYEIPVVEFDRGDVVP